MSLFCSSCNVTFSCNKALKRHYLSKKHLCRAENKLKYVCNCGKSFTLSTNLIRHRKNCNQSNNQMQNTSEIVAQSENILQLLQDRLDEKDEENKRMKKEIEDLRNKVDLLIKITTDNTKSSQKRCKIQANVRFEIKEKQKNTCGMCNKAITDIFELDHIIALQFGGTNEVENLMALCCECHRYKSNQETKYRQDIRQYIQNIIPKRSIPYISS